MDLRIEDLTDLEIDLLRLYYPRGRIERQSILGVQVESDFAPTPPTELLITENLYPYFLPQSHSYDPEEYPCHCHGTRAAGEIFVTRETCATRSCLNFSSAVECDGDASHDCGNQRLGRKQWAALRRVETSNRGKGIVADVFIPQHDLICEYVGEVLCRERSAERELALKKDEPFYLFKVSVDTEGGRASFSIDATRIGGIARYINHSCEPNAEVQTWIVRGDFRLGIFAQRDIGMGEEITFDYERAPNERERQECHCGSLKCKGFF